MVDLDATRRIRRDPEIVGMRAVVGVSGNQVGGESAQDAKGRNRPQSDLEDFFLGNKTGFIFDKFMQGFFDFSLFFGPHALSLINAAKKILSLFTGQPVSRYACVRVALWAGMAD